MPSKKKKDKKPQKETTDLISAVDKTFYEQTIADLNKKLSHLKSHNVKVEEKNTELEEKLARHEEDHADVTSYLSRTLKIQANSIIEFEEKLTALAKVREEENDQYRGIIKDWETKYKTMHEQLTSELKLLNGKLNSLEEFRIQKDELMAKFDQQETELKEQNQKHKDIIYDMEKQQILDKDKLKNEVENRLMQLSDEFARANEIRIAAHVHRMIRENIFLNNSVDHLNKTVEQLQTENKTFNDRIEAKNLYAKTIHDENVFLINVAQKRLNIIEKLTGECESLKKMEKTFEHLEKQRQMTELREMATRKDLNEFKQKIIEMKKSLTEQNVACNKHLQEINDYRNEINRQHAVFIKLSKCIENVLESDGRNSKNVDIDEARAQREILLNEIHSILSNALDLKDPANSNESNENDRAEHLFDMKTLQYQSGLAGITPTRRLSHHMIKYSHSKYKMRRKSVLETNGSFHDDNNAQRTIGTLGCTIIDANNGLIHAAESTRDDDDGDDE